MCNVIDSYIDLGVQRGREEARQEYEAALAEHDRTLAETLAEHDRTLAETLAERDRTFAETLAEKDRTLAALTREIEELKLRLGAV